MIITLNEAKEHLNIEISDNEHNTYLIDLIETAYNVISNDIQDDLELLKVNNNNTFPRPLIHAAKLLICNWFELRQIDLVGVSISKSDVYDKLIMPYKNYSIA